MRNSCLTVTLLAAIAAISGCSLVTPNKVTSVAAESAVSTKSGQEAHDKLQSDLQQDRVDIPVLVAGNPDSAYSAIVQQYVGSLAAQGYGSGSQGVWLQTDTNYLAGHQGTTPLPAASLTKVATTLAALQTFGAQHKFVTIIGKTGTLQNGVLQGDLIVQGSEDPFFVWENAILLGDALKQAGIRQVNGNLIVVGRFYMNFESNPRTAGNLLKQGLDSQLWSSEVETQYYTLPRGTPRSQVVIRGSVQVASRLPGQMQVIVQYPSLPLATILKKMNMYSNNAMAEMLARAVGGASAVRQKVVQITGVPSAEVQIANGSGLGEENRISPRAICAMFMAIDRYLQAQRLTVGDVFFVSGQDPGVARDRYIPRNSVIKTGTLANVSALGGAIATSRHGRVWFAIINRGGDIDGFRDGQDALLQRLIR
ncbi:D-alanyl-D-alanine carboxypeptidase [Pseudanabaena sp. PCC 6802]|uniref:D-alanyl-D-alanine carboxypeptidase n=1 Tax=Pseudanabaena sp. PCC 6802 TaxID=118173 RepID=UPI00034A98A5|nr:D-alanyl-D-alanine carboxypeptidase [Pseudanabaena sp. PCC 6802]